MMYIFLSGSSINIRIRATPILSQDLILAKAQHLKSQDIIKQRKEAERARIIQERHAEEKKLLKMLEKKAKDKEKRLKQQEKKGKKSRSASITPEVEIELPEPLPEPTDSELDVPIDFTEKELEISQQEMADAKKLLEHTMDTETRDEYVLCRLRKEQNALGKPAKEELLRLRVMYTVSRPLFMIDHQDDINFGPVLIGDTRRVMLHLQNTSGDVIYPKVTLLNEDDQFVCHIAHGVAVRPEQVLLVPVTFRPKIINGAFRTFTPLEYFTIYYKTTERTFTVRGMPVEPQLIIRPEFKICRLVMTIY